MADERGQTLVEFVAIVPVIALAIVGTGWILRETTRRTDCARIVFEAVRGRLEGNPETAFLTGGGELRNVEDGVEGSKKCGSRTESLFLPKIDRRKAGASPSRYSFSR